MVRKIKKAKEDKKNLLHFLPSTDQNYFIDSNQILKENGVFKPIGKMYISLSLTEDDFSQTQKAIAKAASELRN